MRLKALGLLCWSVATAQPARTTAFVDVSLVDVRLGRIIEHQTVLVRGGTIAWVGAAGEARMPPGATRVEGGYLLPGFVDMHAHPGSQADLATYASQGITTIRVMWGMPDHLRWRQAARTGLFSPRIVTAGPIIDGSPPSQPSMTVITDAARARAEVTRQQRAGYDFIKIYNSVPKAVYDSIVAVAGELRIQVAGHVPFEVALGGALEARQTSIEHLRGYVAELVPKDAPVQPGATLRSRSIVWNYVDRGRMAALAERTKAAGVTNVPTIVVATHNMLPSAGHAALLERPEVKYLSPADLPDRSKISYLADFTDHDYAETQRGLQGQLDMVRALHHSGARVLVGTDSWLQGFAYQEELTLFEKAGLSRPEVLAAATYRAAEYFNEQGRWGEIKVGQRADLQLVGADPFASLDNLKERRGVMLRGRWYSAEQLAAALDRTQRSR